MKQTFTALYNATEASIKGEKETIVKRRNERAVESSIDSAEDTKMKAEDDLERELSVVANGEVININKVLGLRQTIKNADSTIKELESFKSEFFSGEKTVKKTVVETTTEVAPVAKKRGRPARVK